MSRVLRALPHADPEWELVNWEDRGTEKADGDNDADSKPATGIALRPPSRRDFWRRTFYEPYLVKHSAPAIVASVPWGDSATVETAMTLSNPEGFAQFDQGGILLLVDELHWVKAGIEVVDGFPRLSCVVTNDFSDWSTQVWRKNAGEDRGSSDDTITSVTVRLRVHKVCAGEKFEGRQDASLVFEAAAVQDGDGCSEPAGADANVSWELIRIAHLGSVEPRADWRMGVFAACPVQQKGECTARFHFVSVGPLAGPTHGSDSGTV
jgi:regulation of enolase protein 1 (concanavalin A-like superfamily)